MILLFCTLPLVWAAVMDYRKRIIPDWTWIAIFLIGSISVFLLPYPTLVQRTIGLLLPGITLFYLAMKLENKVVIIRMERLRPEYQTADKQLVLVTGGFGAHANSRGRAVYTTNLYSGKESRWNRGDILGVVKPEYMPDWAKERLKQIQDARQKKLKKYEPER